MVFCLDTSSDGWGNDIFALKYPLASFNPDSCCCKFLFFLLIQIHVHTPSSSSPICSVANSCSYPFLFFTHMFRRRRVRTSLYLFFTHMPQIHEFRKIQHMAYIQRSKFLFFLLILITLMIHVPSPSSINLISNSCHRNPFHQHPYKSNPPETNSN
jgi:hypothetical protein